MEMNVARIRQGIVVNLERMDEEWFTYQQSQSSDVLVPFGDTETPQIGLGYNEVTGEWEQPPAPPLPVPDESAE